MKSFIKMIAAVAVSLSITSAFAQPEPINVIVSLPPGGLTDKINLAMKDGLEKAGYKTNLVRFDNCKGMENWLKANPGKPAVAEYLLANQALHIVDPQHPSACNITLTKESVIVTNHQTQFQACSLRPVREAVELWKSGKAKIGITAAPAINGPLTERIVKDVNPNIQIVRYNGAPAQIQAMVSREVDFVGVFQNASSVTAAGGQCFFTTAGIGKAARNNQISIDDVKPNSMSAGIGGLSVLVGYNVDVAKIRPIASKVVNTHPDFRSHFAGGADMVGIPAGRSAEQQFALVEKYLDYFRK
jgi:tripartite-type tricarboxylate transporter receptor subunit TctC